MKNKSDDFTQSIKIKVAKRVAFICSNPSCKKSAIESDSDNGINNIGVAAYICAASVGA